MFGLLLAFAVEAGWMLWFRFHVETLENSAGLLRCRVVGSGFFGETLLVLARGFPRIAPWWYGFGTVLDLIDGWFSRRESSGPARVGGRSCESGKRSFEEFPRVQRFRRCSSHVQESQESQERERALARRFKLSGFGHRPQAADPISVRMGRSPACTAALARHFHVTKRITFYPCIKTLTRFTHL